MITLLRTSLLSALFAISSNLMAQSEPEYLMEIGGAIGLTAYEGDFNGSILKGNQPSAAVMLRRLMNPRQGFKFQLGIGKLKGSAKDLSTVYPYYDTQHSWDKGYSNGAFSNTMVDLNATYEYNFWPYGTGHEYRGAKPLTPYIAFGAGFTFVTGGGSNAFALNMPVGVGIKYKVNSRVNVNVDWTMHFTTSDMLDNTGDPYNVVSSGMFKNKDCYSQFMVGLTYSFKEKCRVCHNADE